MLTRRTLFKTGAACAAFAMVGAKARFAYAALPDDRRFVVVILRGGLDGMAAVPPHGDPDYASVRGSLALPKSGAGAPINLDGMFGLHPALAQLGEMWAAKELAIFHNIATPYRDRSHFDAQNVLETGGTTAHGLSDGWLNRALQPLGLDTGSGALAVASSPPLILDGASRVTSWLPSRLPAPDEEYMRRVSDLYARDAVFSVALKQALVTRATATAAMHDSNDAVLGAMMPQAQGAQADAVAPLMEGAGKILGSADGPRVAVFDISGWDTHFNEGAGEGQLARRLGQLDQGLAALKTALGPLWKKTVVVTATEFGRTVAVNGTGGTDHGTGGIAFVMGGAVSGGNVHAEWVGLKPSTLKDGRDLPPRTDTRALFKAALVDHLGVPARVLEDRVFPDSAGAAPVKGLIAA